MAPTRAAGPPPSFGPEKDAGRNGDDGVGKGPGGGVARTPAEAPRPHTPHSPKPPTPGADGHEHPPGVGGRATEADDRARWGAHHDRGGGPGGPGDKHGHNHGT